MTRARSNSPCSPEFKAEAARLFHESGKSLQRMAEELGVGSNSLRKWTSRLDIQNGPRAGVTAEERRELKRLRRENRILREERAILKNAAAVFFADETKNRK